MPYATTGYHTCRDEGGPTHIQQNAPFLATVDPFLSSGYYYWEYREADAHAWGTNRKRFPKGYAVCQCELELDYLLDLEYPDDLDWLYDLERQMHESGSIPLGWPIGKLIAWFRDLNDIDVFPFDSIRMRQEPPREHREQRMFAASQPYKMLTWRPQFIVCTFSRTPPVVKSCTLIYQEHYRPYRR